MAASYRVFCTHPLKALNLPPLYYLGPKLHRRKFFFLCCLTCFDMTIASVPYQNFESILWYGTEEIAMSKQFNQHRKKNYGGEI